MNYTVSVKSTLPALRKNGVREILRAPSPPGQVGYPPSMNTEARVTSRRPAMVVFAASWNMGYFCMLACTMRDVNGDALVRPVRQTPKGQSGLLLDQ